MIYMQSLRDLCLYASVTHCESMRKEHTLNLRISTKILKIRKYAISCCEDEDTQKINDQFHHNYNNTHWSTNLRDDQLNDSGDRCRFVRYNVHELKTCPKRRKLGTGE